MSTNIGGINVGIGANVKNVLKGFDVVDTQLRQFQKKMSNIRLASIVKGDPFSETRKHFKTVKTELNSVFNSWSKNMGYVEGSMGKFAEKSRKVTEATILHWQKVNKEFSKVKGTGEAVAKGKKFDLNLNEIVGDPDKFAQKVINPTFLKNFEKMRTILTKIKPELKGYFDLINTEFGKVKSGYLIRSFEGNEKIAQKIEVASKEVRKAFKGMNIVFTEEELKIIKNYENFGKELKVAFKKTGISEHKQSVADMPKTVHKEELESLKKKELFRARINAQIAEAIRLNKSNSILLGLYQQKEKAGIILKKEELELQRLIKREATRRHKQEVADMPKTVHEEHLDSLKKKELFRVRINAQIAEAIKLNKSEAILLNLYQEKEKAGIILKKEKLELQRLNKRAVEKEINSVDALISRQKENSLLAVGRGKNNLPGGYELKSEPAREGISYKYDKLKEKITQRRFKLLSDITLKNREINKEIQMGITIDKNKERIAKNLLRLKEEGFILDSKQSKFVKTTETNRKRNEALKVEEKRKRTIEKLQVAYRKLATTIKEGIAPSEVISRLEEKRTKLSEYGITLSKRQTAVLNEQIKKQKIIQGFKGGFLSPSWMKQRAGWFLQLRGFWGMYRVITELYQATKDLEKELAGLNAVTLATDANMESMKETVIATSKVIAVDIVDIARGMIKLGQAGLKVAEVNSAIRSVATLAAATMTDMDTSSDLITTSMRAWEMGANQTVKIIDTLANTVNNSKVNIKGLSTALQYLTGVAPQVNMSLRDTSAIIGIMANRGIKMSKVGTGFRSLLGELLKPSAKFRKELYNIGLTLKDVDINSRNVIDIIETLSDAGFNATKAFRGLDRRAAAAISALVSGAGDLRNFAESLDAVGTASEMAQIQMGTLIAKTTLLKNKTVALTTRIYDNVKPLMKFSVDVLSAIIDWLSKLGKVGSAVGSILGTIFSSIVLIGTAKYLKLLLGIVSQLKVFAALFATITALLTPQALAFIAVTAAMLYSGKALIGYRYNLDKQRVASVKARKELFNLRSEYNSFNTLSDKYKKAMAEGNIEEATRIAQQDTELQQIHALHSATNEYNNAIEERTEKYKENIKAVEELSKKEELLLFSRLAEEATFQVGKGVLSDTSQRLGASLGKRLHGETTRESAKEKKRLKESLTFNEQETKKLQESQIIINRWASDFIDKGVITSVEQGMKVLEKEMGLGFSKIVENSKSASEQVKENISKLLDVKQIEEKKDNILKGIKEVSQASPEILSNFIDTAINANEALKNFFKTNKTVYNNIKELAKKDLGKAMEYIDNLGEHYKGIEPGYYKTAAKGVLEKYGVAVNDKTKELIANLARALEDRAISKKLSGLFNPTWESFEKELETIEQSIKKIGKTRTELERKVASVTESYRKKREKYETTEKDFKAVDDLFNVEKRHIAALIIEYDRKKQIEITSQELAIENLNEINNFQQKRNSLEASYTKQKKDINLEISKAQDSGYDNLVKTLKTLRDLYPEIYNIKIKDTVIAEQLGNKQLSLNKELLSITSKQNKLEDTALDKLKNEASQLSANESFLKYKLYISKELRLTDIQLFEINKELNGIYEDQTMNLHNQRKETDLLYNAFWTLKKQAGSFNDLMKESTSSFAIGMGEGLGNMLFQASSGFQENRQAVVDLKGELEELKEEKDELNEDGILSSDEAERLEEINEEMSDLNSQVKDLENPIKSLGETFKDFFKSLIDEINKAITRWIAMKIVMGILGKFDNSASISASVAGTGPGIDGIANGGILGNITAFRKFSNGGTINSPTLAAIGEGTGDNREIVVPMKNIKDNNVSGYMQDKSEPIVNILNVVTENDLAAIMSKPTIGQVIVNRVYQNKNNQGILSRG